MAEQTRTLRASCFCKASKVSFTVPTSSLPLATYFCNCGICRRMHGTLCTIHTTIPAPVVDLSTFTSYASSNRVVRYFCPTCGAHMLDHYKADGKDDLEWHISTSLVDAEEDVWDFQSHIELDGTGDGGLGVLLEEINGKRLKRWQKKPIADSKFQDTGDWDVSFVSPLGLHGSDAQKLKARCHCGGMELHIARPQNEDAFKHMPQSLTPKNKQKWYAIHDVCNSCRLLSGCAIVSWLFPESSHITLSDGSPYTPIFGTAKAFKSSEGVTRTFCGTCGAVFTYTCDDRPEMIDIAVGLLDADGVRAEDWLEWRTHKCAYDEDAVWKRIVEALLKGMNRNMTRGSGLE